MANILPGEGRNNRAGATPVEDARTLRALPHIDDEAPGGDALTALSRSGPDRASSGEAIVFANVARSQFEAHVHGQVVAVLAYAEVPGEPSALELTHTVVRPGFADHGWGDALILQVLRWLEDREVEPVVRCPLVRRVCDTLDSLGPTESYVLPGAAGGAGFADAG